MEILMIKLIIALYNLIESEVLNKFFYLEYINIKLNLYDHHILFSNLHSIVIIISIYCLFSILIIINYLLSRFIFPLQLF